jgi:hypothetical protein
MVEVNLHVKPNLPFSRSNQLQTLDVGHGEGQKKKKE